MIYEVISEVQIRREPRIVEYIDPKTKKLITNAVGKLTVGIQREVHGTIVDKNNATWGRISESDAAGISEYVCIENINRTFMKIVETSQPPIVSSELEARFNKLEAWAKIQGYKP